VLRLLRRRCLARLRKEAEPVPPEVLGAFLPAWQNAGQRGAARVGGRSEDSAAHGLRRSLRGP
jgi:ATP-dependent Lhr-like helicase